MPRATAAPSPAPVAATAPWHVLWTRSHCERRLHETLLARGYDTLLPEVTVWSRGAEGRRVVRRPMFPGYLFLRHALDKESYLDVAKSPGFVAVLGERWDRPAEVPESEVEALRAVSASGAICMPHPFLRSGARVRIVGGSLAGVEGVLLRRRDERGLLVVSVELLRRSVSLEIDCTAVVPI